ncbi:chitinase [Salinivibrio sp. ML198]|nr:glycosyl hydrolase family 18 protein [Salinivibrio sp. ML198]OOE80743.1 chitinase [Salinivibrio sp. ML198]
MKPMTLLSLAIAGALGASHAVAAPSTPSLDWKPQNYSFVEVDEYGRGSYKDLVQRVDEVQIEIKWNAWSGDGGDSYKVYFDDQVVNQGTLPAGTKSGVVTFPYDKGGRHQLKLALCEGGVDGQCATSAAKPIVIADTDGVHLDPLPMNVDPNNNDYPKQPDTVVGAYFVEWGIYGRNFDVSQVPAGNLTHILYGFIPICGPNESLGDIENGNSLRALELACQGSQDYEVVIHDPWAAIQKKLPGTPAKDPIGGTYAQMMALKQRYPDLKILPSVGGWTLSDPFYDFTDKANRDVFVASMKEFLQTWKFYDGVDIDWEYPGGGGANPDLGNPDKDSQAYAALMRELRAMLDELEADTGREYQLTSAVGAGYDKIANVDYSASAPYMDYIFAMTYDFFGAWNNVTGHQTAIYCGSHMSADECDGTGVDDNGEPRKGPAYTLDNGVQLLLESGVPPEKMVIGTAMYGRGWEGVFPANATDPSNPMTAPGNGPIKGSTADGIWEAGVIDYKGIVKSMLGSAGNGINGFQPGYDEQAEAAYVWNPDNGKLVTYDNQRSVKAKGQYVRNHNFAGLFAWEIDADNGDILNAMHEGLAQDGQPPVNNAPTVTLAQQSYTLAPGASLTIAANGRDRDGDALTYRWQGDAALALTNSDTDSVTVTAPDVSTSTDYSLSVTVSDGQANAEASAIIKVVVPGENQAPTVAPIVPVSLKSGEQTSVTIEANDPDGDTLSYTYRASGDLAVSGTGDQVTLTAPTVTENRDYVVTVEVSDGDNTTQAQFTVTVTPASGLPTWDENTVYVGGDRVLYQGVEYRAKWWTKGQRPDQGDPWERVGDSQANQSSEWQATVAYSGGAEVEYNNQRYQAKWWTQGDKPGSAAVWQLL